MDYNALVQFLLGPIGPYQMGGVSSHRKTPSPVSPEMRRDAEIMEAWRKSGKTFPLYQKFPNPKPKAI